MSPYLPKKKIGYLGGGQLAQMLTLSAHRMGLEAHVLSENKTDPAALVTGFWKKGNLNQVSQLKSFMESCDVVTFESEFLNAEKLTQIQKTCKTPIYPSPALMGTLQDRKSQKELLDQYKLATSPWLSATSQKEVNAFITKHSFPIVFKKRLFGYDGYGTFVVRTSSELDTFLKTQWKNNAFIIEKFIPFKKEVAILVARSLDQSITHFPFVESQQKDSRCDWIKGPIKIKEQKSWTKKLQLFLKKINYVGVMGVEFFMTDKGLLINELAPRVHNTGHYTQNIDHLSQFDIHNMCLLGLKLPKEIQVSGGFAMANLIGTGQKVELKVFQGLHWYGKMENRKNRKMGHLNTTDSTPEKALKKVLKLRGEIKL